MKLSKKSEAMLVYNAYWDNYLKGDVEAMIPLLDDEYTQVGSAETEVFFNKKDAVQFLYDTIDQVAGKLEMRNRSTKLEQKENMILFHELCDVYVLTDKKWNFYSKFRASTLMQKKEMGWKITHQHSSMPDIRTEEGENIAIEKISKENLELRDAIKRRTIELEHKNRDLEIESSLERVRALAMGMRKPDDLQDICEVLFTELQALGFYELRNAMINIYNDDKSSFLNYDFSTNAGKTVIAMPYNFHPLIEKQVRITKSASDAFFEFSFSGKELKDFMELRKKNAELDDPKLEDTSSLHYYFYSIDTGSIGISTYSSITEEKLNLLKRFRNVFDFAYRRYMDVSQAEAQAREAKIEASLERVRSRSLAMHSSDELVDASSVLFNELKLLNIETIRTGVGIVDELNKTVEVWSSQLIERKQNNILGVVPFNIHPFFIGYFESWKRKEFYFSYEMVDVELKEYYKTVSPLLSYPEKKEFNSKESFYIFFFPEGSLNVITLSKLSEDDCRLMIRFARVFGLIYRRFLDLQQAEVQAREAQIQLGLERVRARTMAMQHSDELQDAAALLFQQMKALGVQTGSCGFNIWNKDEKAATVWMSSAEGGLQAPFKMPHTEGAIYKNVYAAMKNGETFMVKEVGGKALEKHFDYLLSLPGIGDVIKHLRETAYTFPETMVYHFAFFNNGYLSFHLHEPCPAAHDIFKRFAKAFEQTYTRFLDLQKAESQAKEAQIELSLERVRARTMAMQKSDELPETSHILFEQMKELGEPVEQLTIGIVQEENNVIEISATLHGDTLKKIYLHSIDEPYMMTKVFKAWKTQQKTLIVELKGDELNSYNKYRNELTNSEMFPTNLGDEHRRIVYAAFFSKGMLALGANEPRPPQSLQLLERFASVFDLTYTRFLDLQKAEAQAREAQIETALERVRSRTMGMQKSEELKELIQVVYEQFVHLNIKVEHAGFVMDYKARDDYNIWVADPLEVPSQVIIPYFDSVYYNRFNEAKEKGEDFFATNLSFEEKNRFYKKLFEYVPGLTEEATEFYFSCAGLAASTVLLENICLYIENFSGIPYTDEENNTLMRFGKVFQQTYTRFLDLQKAEAQAREARIETALEKVRSRTMAMQKSSELADTATVLFKEMNLLVDNLWLCGFVLCEKDSPVDEWWLSGGNGFLPDLYLPRADDALHENMYNIWLNGETYYAEIIEGEALQQHYKWLMTIPSAKKAFESQAAVGIEKPVWQQLSCAYFSHGYLVIITQQPCNEEQIFKRFAQVFDQTYTRFLDLQKAEAQAREATIEASLEKVRGRAMAMHNSSDLSATASIVFIELRKLGIHTVRSGVGLLTKDSYKVLLYATTASSENPELSLAGEIDMAAHPCLKMQYESCLNKENYFPVLSGDDLKAYYKELTAQISVPPLTDEHYSHEHYGSYFPFSQGYFYVWTEKPYTENETNILNRFKAIVDLTFRRYLDLQKAEAQTREAQIEAGLERVRSRTLAMHSSDELAETAAIVFKQLSDLGIAPNRLYIFIINDETSAFEAWITEEDGKKVSQRFEANIRQSPVFAKIYDGWKAQKKSITIDLQGKELTDYIQFLSEELHVPVTTGHSQKRRVQSVAYFSQGCIGIASPESQPNESIDLLERFAGVFNLTYTRFNDLLLAEAQTHKANIEVALERVRARALAMQQPEELVEVAQVMRHEMGLMGVEELEISSIFIHDEGSDKAETWYAIKEGRDSEKRLVSGNFIINLNETWVGRQMIEFYNSTNQEVSIPMVGADRKEWFYYCSRQSKVLEGFYDDNIPDRIYHLLKFSNGAIGAATAGEISEESRDLLKRAASVFSLAYSRFKDLSKARLDLQELKEEKKKSDALLLNILPVEIADELKKFGKSYARKHDQVTILFADIKGFSSIAENLSAEELVAQLDECFRAFDNIVDKHGLEKIKTIGDAYVAACGLPKPVPDNAIKTVRAALDMIEFIKGFGLTKKIQNLPVFEFRVGIHTGPVITGVVGLKKFTYDIWGDAVNMAARMEQHGEAGKINISGNTYQLIKEKFTCIHRGKVEAKNKGEVDMYFVEKGL